MAVAAQNQAAAGAAGGDGNNNNNNNGGGSSLVKTLVRGVIIYMLVSWLFSGSSPPAATLPEGENGELLASEAGEYPSGDLSDNSEAAALRRRGRERIEDPPPVSNELGMLPTVSDLLPSGQLPVVNALTGSVPDLRCMYAAGQRLQMRILLSPEAIVEPGAFADVSKLSWFVPEFGFGDWDVDLHQSIGVPLTTDLLHNGTLYAHVLFARSSDSIPLQTARAVNQAVYVRHLVNRYMPKREEKKTRNLLDTSQTSTEESAVSTTGDGLLATKVEKAPVEIVSYWAPNVTITLVSDLLAFKAGQLPPQIRPFLKIDRRGRFQPIVFFNDFWLLDEHWSPLNDTLTEDLELHFSFYPIGSFRWQLYHQLDQSLDMQRSNFGSSQSEIDELKRMLVESNPYLLGLTVVVSLLHTVFDFLAFKNDITFWKTRKTLEGLSVRSVFVSGFCQLIIFLYLLDNDTTWMVLLSSGIGTVIEFWKITKVANVSIVRRFPFIRVEDRASYTSATKKYDDLAMRYLSWVLYPLVFGYAVYGLIYDEHKSWYSWVLSTGVSCIYVFGFILMTPQLFINYKMKSVSHLPWRAFTYKFLGTIVDDLFAMVVPSMPMLHRLACFRDDIVFLVMLYQRWIYPVDKKRINEYGQGGEDPHEIGQELDHEQEESSSDEEESDSDSSEHEKAE